MQKQLFWLGKALQGIALLVVLAGILISIQLGLNEDGLASMAYEGKALLVGGVMFFVGWLLQRSAEKA